jgi:hypothetical protein
VDEGQATRDIGSKARGNTGDIRQHVMRAMFMIISVVLVLFLVLVVVMNFELNLCIYMFSFEKLHHNDDS